MLSVVDGIGERHIDDLIVLHLLLSHRYSKDEVTGMFGSHFPAELANPKTLRLDPILLD